jgi:hypothetical protein
MRTFLNLRSGLFFALLCVVAPGVGWGQVWSEDGLPLSGGTLTAPNDGNGSTTAAVTIRSGLLSSNTALFRWGSSASAYDELLLEVNTQSGRNTLALQNDNLAAFPALTFRLTDNNSPTTTPFEHQAIGCLQGSTVYCFIEDSAFDLTGNRYQPPTEFRLQQSGGVDPTGGVTFTCATTINSPTITCPANSIINADLITGAGVPAYTTISSGGGTTTLTMSANATATSASVALNFTNPTFLQYTYYKATQTGPVYWYDWAGNPLLTISRQTSYRGVGIGQLNGPTPAATLEVGAGGAQFDSAVTNQNVTNQGCYDYQVPTTGGTVTLSSSKCFTILEPAGTLATLTVVMPANPATGRLAGFSTTQAITALTVSPSSGQVIRGGTTPTTMTAGGALTMIYNANTVWYPYAH